MSISRRITGAVVLAVVVVTVSNPVWAAGPFERLRHENAELVDIIRAQALLIRYLQEAATGPSMAPDPQAQERRAMHLPLAFCEASALEGQCHELSATFSPRSSEHHP